MFVHPFPASKTLSSQLGMGNLGIGKSGNPRTQELVDAESGNLEIGEYGNLGSKDSTLHRVCY